LFNYTAQKAGVREEARYFIVGAHDTANPNKAGLQTQTRQDCKSKQDWFTNANKALGVLCTHKPQKYMPDKVLEGWRRQRPRPVAAFGRRQDPK